MVKKISRFVSNITSDIRFVTSFVLIFHSFDTRITIHTKHKLITYTFPVEMTKNNNYLLPLVTYLEYIFRVEKSVSPIFVYHKLTQSNGSSSHYIVRT